MFEDSLFASAGRPNTAGCKYAPLLSFTIQILLAGVLVIAPLLYTQALPARKVIALLKAPVAAPEHTVEVTTATPARRQTKILDGHILLPRSIPRHVSIVGEQQHRISAPSALDVPVGAIPGPGAEELISSIVAFVPLPAPPPPAPQPIRVSQGMAAGLLAYEVKPAYPRIAIQAGVKGSVVLKARISKDGRIQNLQVASGHPMLIRAAINAVSQWRYQPYLLNGEPVEVETQITVNFVLAGR